MKYLKFPFAEKMTIQVQNGLTKKEIECELASSAVEIFQSLNYRKKEDFVIPLVLKFDSPVIQSLSWQNFSFPVEQICVVYKEHIVKKVNIINTPVNTANFIQGYSEFSFVIFAPLGFSNKYKIIEDKTIIK